MGTIIFRTTPGPYVLRLCNISSVHGSTGGCVAPFVARRRPTTTTTHDDDGRRRRRRSKNTTARRRRPTTTAKTNTVSLQKVDMGKHIPATFFSVEVVGYITQSTTATNNKHDSATTATNDDDENEYGIFAKSGHGETHSGDIFFRGGGWLYNPIVSVRNVTVSVTFSVRNPRVLHIQR